MEGRARPQGAIVMPTDSSPATGTPAEAEASALVAQLQGQHVIAMKLIEGLSEQQQVQLALACRSILAYVAAPQPF